MGKERIEQEHEVYTKLANVIVLHYGGQVSVGFKALVWSVWRCKINGHGLKFLRHGMVFDRLKEHYAYHGAIKLPWDLYPFPKTDVEGRRDVRKAIAWVKKTWKDIEPEVIP